ncbi:hypothetical protein ABK040_004544 [Willaertia magna]
MLKITTNFTAIIAFIIVTLTSFLLAASVTNTRALNFGGNSFVNFTNIPTVANGQFYNNFVNKSVSLSTWFYYDNIANVGQNEGLVGALGFSSTGSVAGFGIFVKQTSPNSPQVGVAYSTNYVGTSTASALSYSTTTLQSKKWYFITVVYTPDETNKKETIELYLDGAKQQTVTNTPASGNGTVPARPSLKFDNILTNAIDFRLGGGEDLTTGANRLFTGALDDTKLYNTALSANYISQQFSAVTLDTAENGLVVYYPFENNANDVKSSVNGQLSGSGGAYIAHVLPSPPTNTTTSPKRSNNATSNNLSFGILGLLLSIIASVLLF